MTDSTRKVMQALQAQGYEVLSGKGGFWLRGKGFITLAQARVLTGIEAPKREYRPRISAYGDYAIVAMLNRKGVQS